MGIDNSINTEGRIRPTSIYGTNQVSANMLIDMSGGSMYGPLVFEPETLKIKDSEGNVKTIEEKLAEIGNGGGDIPSGNYLTKEQADLLYTNETFVTNSIQSAILDSWEVPL